MKCNGKNQDVATKCRSCDAELQKGTEGASVTIESGGHAGGYSGVTFCFMQITSVAAQKLTQECLLENGFRLVKGNASDGFYEKGSAVVGLLFGSLFKKTKLRMQVFSAPVGVDIVLSDYTGFRSGLIRIIREKKTIQFFHSILFKQIAERIVELD